MKLNNRKVICPRTGEKVTQFEAKYGCHVKDFARAEGTTPAAIHMRVMNFGTPYQRRARPTVCEILTGYSKRFIASHIDLHYNSIAQKILTRQGQIDVMNRLQEAKGLYSPVYTDNILLDMTSLSTDKWTSIDQQEDKWSWLMLEHEDYLTWRYDHTVMLLENKYGRL